MNAPAMRAMMQRRILVNYRVDPDVLGERLPAPFRPALVGGSGMAGICLIRLGDLRPVGVPPVVGLTSENAAHRIAVEWDGPDGVRTGVYVPRRDTSSRLAVFGGGRMFPGRQHRARFRVREAAGRYDVEFTSLDRTSHVLVAAHDAPTVMARSLFDSTEAASVFFRSAPMAYTPTPTSCTFQGVELHTDGWEVRPLHIDAVQSSYFDDPTRFPPGTATLDSAFLMAGLATTWRPGTLVTAPHESPRPCPSH